MFKAMTTAIGAIGLTACATHFEANDVRDVAIYEFHTDSPHTCQYADIDLTSEQAMKFFQRAQRVDALTLLNDYDDQPCYIEGTAFYIDSTCDWKIRPGMTGEMICGERVYWFACDDCDDLSAE